MTTSPSPSDPAAVALELERIRRTIEVGFTRTDGALALLVQRHDQTDEQIKDHARRLDDVDARLDTVERGETDRQKRTETRLDALERTRWPLPSVAALVALCGLLLSLYQLTSP
ncbi:hypothetical protein KQH42_07385 [Streptomyces sp. CHA1]|uniref:hypothetical protein n=1 Tax=Streptomyces TaxID=1883 RepID=UPI001BFC7AE3|nr:MULTISPECIES: hypothetical protein [unclassified Streptomyces]MBT3157337.1 hypothetical protein [Streptomyces sp. G11C]MCO6700338.1 hypothetical protein [Streptomyces sp. CHB9.2]MCO6706474.1 hypothetical protein [Streptomyces sp. CHA3]MCO6712216.1 hypothetical protein [Streptomyces sp. CHB19.2]MCO6718650.1 hypothetical protein [Streptomyces sp. Vc714c-19]